MTTLSEFKDTLNKRLFDFDLLELRYGLGQTDRLSVKDQYNNKKFMADHFFDDLFEVGKSNALFTDRAKSLINELANDSGISIKFMYRQSIVLKGDE